MRAGAGMSVRKSKKQRSDEKSRMLFDLEMPVSRDVQQESMKEGTGETLVESARATAVGSNIEWKAGAELAEQGILAGTSAFTAAGWGGIFAVLRDAVSDRGGGQHILWNAKAGAGARVV